MFSLIPLFSSLLPGGAVVPGLVDGHTHPVWAGDRVAEFAMKLAGATYMQVLVKTFFSL
jgi:imidazolonepropionase-like amidohydrolase